MNVIRRLRDRLPQVRDVVVNQFALGAYRQGFVDALAATGADIVFLVGDEHFNLGVVTAVDSSIVRRTGANVFLLGRRLGWQRGCLGHGLRARFLVVELNPRNLTSWLLLALRRVARRRTAGWGHAHSRRGPAPEHNRARRVMQRLCTELIAYTETEAGELRAALPGISVRPARNSIYSVEQQAGFPVRPVPRRRDLLLLGRLVPEKKTLLGVAAFAEALPDLPADVVLHVVGSGPQEAEIREAVAPGLDGRVRVHGWVPEPEPVLGDCWALLSPGYIGLNAIQALGCGTPVLYARDEPHSPEIESLGPANSRAFDSDDVHACRRAIVDLYRDRADFDAEAIAAAARAEYATDRMIEPFLPFDTRGAAMSEPTPPDRPIATALKPLRAAVRRARTLRLQVSSGGKLDVGRNFAIGRGGRILSPNVFRAGDDVHIGMDFLCEVDVTIGSGVLVSSRVCLIGDDHEIPPAGTPIYTAGRRPSQHVRLEGDNLVGNGTTIVGSVTIGYGAVIGAGSLVLSDVPPDVVYVGRPARFLRHR